MTEIVSTNASRPAEAPPPAAVGGTAQPEDSAASPVTGDELSGECLGDIYGFMYGTQTDVFIFKEVDRGGGRREHRPAFVLPTRAEDLVILYALRQWLGRPRVGKISLKPLPDTPSVPKAVLEVSKLAQLAMVAWLVEQRPPRGRLGAAFRPWCEAVRLLESVRDNVNPAVSMSASQLDERLKELAEAAHKATADMEPWADQLRTWELGSADLDNWEEEEEAQTSED